MFGNFKRLKIDHFEKWKARAPKLTENPSSKFLNILSMRSISCKNMKWEFGNVGSISIQKHVMEMVIWGQYLSNNMKCIFGSMGSISSNKDEMDCDNSNSINLSICFSVFN